MMPISPKKSPGPEWITLVAPSGERRFRYGSRRTKASDRGAPDPSKHVHPHPRSTEAPPRTEARNLNRAHPGKADGALTLRMAYGIMQLLKAEKVSVAFDFHEAGPESRLAWMVVANAKNLETAAAAVLDLAAVGLEVNLEPSSETFRGLSLPEWGDETAAQAFLFETPNPSMVNDATGIGVVNDAKLPLSKRVGGQLAAFSAAARRSVADSAFRTP